MQKYIFIFTLIDSEDTLNKRLSQHYCEMVYDGKANCLNVARKEKMCENFGKKIQEKILPTVCGNVVEKLENHLLSLKREWMGIVDADQWIYTMLIYDYAEIHECKPLKKGRLENSAEHFFVSVKCSKITNDLEL